MAQQHVGSNRHEQQYAPGFPSPVPGDGRVILGRRDSGISGEGMDDVRGKGHWGPEPVPLSPEASPLMQSTPASGAGGQGSQPPHLGLDASSSTNQTNHSGLHSANLSASGSGTSASASRMSASSSRAQIASLGERKVSLGERKASAKTTSTMHTSTTTDLTMTDKSNDSAGTGSPAATTVSVSMLSSPYRSTAGNQYQGPNSPANVRNILGGRGAVESSAAAAALSQSPSAGSLPFAGGDGRRRSSTAYQSSELDYSTSAGGSMKFGAAQSPYMSASTMTGRRPSALTDITASTAMGSIEGASIPLGQLSDGGSVSASLKSSGSTVSGKTSKSRKKERNALRRTNSQSDILKVMAGGGAAPHLTLEEKSRRKSDTFLRRVHEMQIEQRRKLVAVQEAEELRLQQQHDPQTPLYEIQEMPESVRSSSRSLSVSGTQTSGTSTSGSATVTVSNFGMGTEASGSHSGGSATVAHSNAGLTVGSGMTDSTSKGVGGPPNIRRASVPDDASDSSSLHKFIGGILGLGAPAPVEKSGQQQQQKIPPTRPPKSRNVVSDVPSQLTQQQQGPTNTGQYLNETAFVQLQRQRAMTIAMQQQQQQQQQASSSVISGGAGSKSKRSSRNARQTRRRSEEGLPLDIIASMPASAPQNHRALYPGLQQQQQQPPQQQQQPSSQRSSRGQNPYGQMPQNQHASPGRGGFVITGPGMVEPRPHQHAPGASCTQCAVLEKQLMALQADLEYLRSVILQNEFICAECESPGKRSSTSSAIPSSGASISSTKSKSSRKSRKKYCSSNSFTQLGSEAQKTHESEALTDVSQRLMTVTSRHKRQVENMTKETARWQNDMHLKLSKMSMMCKDLNDESAKRKEEAISTQTTLAKVRADRNSLQAEVEALKARIGLYEKEDVENDLVSRELQDKEAISLDAVDRIVDNHDSALHKVTAQLGRTLDSLDMERRRQRLQHQNLTDASHSERQKATSFSAAQASESSFFNPLFGIARKPAEGYVDRAAMERASSRELSLQERCEDLEKELKVAKEELHRSGKAVEEA